MVRRTALLVFLFTCAVCDAAGQDSLFTARGYWAETRKSPYKEIASKVETGDSLTASEKSYLAIYTEFLRGYFEKMPLEERDKYFSMLKVWNNEMVVPTAKANVDAFEWKTHDRLSNGVYGLYYGIAATIVAGISGPAAAGLPIMTTGVWLLGPAFNEKKYLNITRTTIRAANTGRLFGVLHGYALGLAVGGSSPDLSKYTLSLSIVGSIVTGEVAFQVQKRKQFSPGHVEMMRHWAFMGPWIASATAVSLGTASQNIYGMALLGGGGLGFIAGRQVSNSYDFTRGDVDVVQSFTLISGGFGAAAVSETVRSGSDLKALILIPAATSLIGTFLEQRAVRGARFTDQQGGTINLATGGAALLGAGLMTATQIESTAVIIGVPSAMALIAHQVLFKRYKSQNMTGSKQGRLFGRPRYNLSLNVTPENYFVNQSIPVTQYSVKEYTKLMAPIASLTIKF